MKKVTMETNFNEIKEAAAALGINYVGKKKEFLVEAINTAIDAQAKPQKSGKWFEEEGFAFNEGDKVKVVGGPLEGRLAIINKPSAKRNAVKAFLIKEGTENELQKTNVTLDYDKIELVKEEVEEAV